MDGKWSCGDQWSSKGVEIDAPKLANEPTVLGSDCQHLLESLSNNNSSTGFWVFDRWNLDKSTYWLPITVSDSPCPALLISLRLELYTHTRL